MTRRVPWEYAKVDGFILTEDYLKIKPIFDDWEVYDEDIWIVGSSKSGTNWSQEMVWLIENDLNFEGAKQQLKERVPHWELSSVMNITRLAKEKGIKVSQYQAETLTFIKENKVKGKPMCLKSHMPFNLLPNQIKDGSKKPKIIYIARDPKDCVVSIYHFWKNLWGYEGTLEDAVEIYLRDEYLFAPVWDHTISYWNERNRPNLLIITYEDMVKDLPAVINKVATFLGKKYTSEQIKELANHLSFQSMKGNKAVNFTDFADFSKQFGTTPKGDFIRSGKVGSYKDEMSPEMIEKFNQIGLEKTKESGWKFV